MNILLRILAIFLVTSLASCVLALGNDSSCCSEKAACDESCEEAAQAVMDMQCCLDAAALGQECAECTGK